MKNKLERLGKKIALATGITLGATLLNEGMQAEVVKTDSFNDKKELKYNPSELDKTNLNTELMTFNEEGSQLVDNFDFEKSDTIPDNSEKYGYKYKGTRKMLANTIEVGYYGTDETKTLVKAPFRAEKKSTDKIYTLGDLYPAMGDRALFYNCSPEGSVHFVELPSTVKVFVQGDHVFALICGNRLVYVKGEEQPPEKDNKKKEDLKPKKDVGKKENSGEKVVKLRLVSVTYYWNTRQGRRPTLERGNVSLVIPQVTIQVPLSELKNAPNGEIEGYPTEAPEPQPGQFIYWQVAPW